MAVWHLPILARGVVEMADDDDHKFESADAGASATYPMQATAQQISGRGIALQVIFDLTDGLGFLS